MPGVKGRSGGRNAKTIERLKLEGTFDPKRHQHTRHPSPPKGVPSPPARLYGAALREWKHKVQQLARSELLTVVDGAMLFHYCELHGAMEAMKTELRALAKSRAVNAPQQKAALRRELRQHANTIRPYLVEFGLSPAARSRVNLSPAGAGAAAGTSDDMTEFDQAPPLKLVR